MAGFLGLLLFVVLLGIRLLIFHHSPLDLICLLQVFGCLGFYVLNLFVLFFFFFLPWPSSSPSVVSFCSFSSSRGLVLGLALVLFYDDNRMGGFLVFFIITITIYMMLFFMVYFLIFIFRLASHG